MKRFLKFIALSFAAVLLFGFTACKDDPNTIRVGASAVPHAEILAAVEDDLKEQGYTLKIDIYSDYVLPNTAVQSGELLANFFQHQPYLTQFNKGQRNRPRERGKHSLRGVRDLLGDGDGRG